MSKPIGTFSVWNKRKKGSPTSPIALLSVYDKTGLILFAEALEGAGFRLLGSGGTAKKIRDAGIPIEWVVTVIFFYGDRN
jgi:MGS-like domain